VIYQLRQNESTKAHLNIPRAHRPQAPRSKDPGPFSFQASIQHPASRIPHPAPHDNSTMNPALVFLDAEFTDLIDPVLLSIGMVTADGREFYAELDRNDPANAATFNQAGEFALYGGVLDQWGVIPGSAVTANELGERTAAWILEAAARLGGPILLAYDYQADLDLLVKAIQDAGLWDAVRQVMKPLHVDPSYGSAANAEVAEDAVEICFDELRDRDLYRHHALADAHALRAACTAVGVKNFEMPKFSDEVGGK
jgi:hypothetical protein